jgi:5'-nucleotidase / UDP-sugar diphosphatase
MEAPVKGDLKGRFADDHENDRKMESVTRRLWRQSIRLLLLLLIAVPLDVRGLPAAQLTVLHLNDFHGHLLPDSDKSMSSSAPAGGAARLARMIADERAKNPEGVLLLSAGDMFQGTPISNIFGGQSVMEVMNYLKFDAMALGNHEFDWGTGVLQQLAAAATFPFLAANIRDLQGRGLPLTQPHVILQRNDLKLAVIGITTPETIFTTKPDHVAGLTFCPPAEVLPQLLKELRGRGADLIILLSHSGLDADMVIAEQVSGIDVIVGGHSHTAVTHPLRVNDTLIVQAGSYGAYLGVLQLDIDPITHKILAYTRENELKPVLANSGEPVDEKAAAIVAHFNDQIKGAFARVVGETTVDLERNAREESNVGDLIADALRETTGADFAFQNGGGIRANIPRGKITLEQVYTLLPFDNIVVAMDLTGDRIRGLLEQNAASAHQLLQISGLSVHYDLGRPAGLRVIKVMIGNQPLVPQKTYRVATNDFLAAGGDQYTTFKEGTNIVYGDPVRDEFAAYLDRHSPVNPITQNRIEITKP